MVREYATHAAIGGTFLVLTGFAPEEWLAHAVHATHLPESALHLWATGIDVRTAVVIECHRWRQSRQFGRGPFPPKQQAAHDDGDADAYAVHHPERVTHLILYGGYAQGSLHRTDADVGTDPRHDDTHTMAAGIQGARLVALPGRNHILLPGDPAREHWAEEIEQFLATGR